MDFGIQKYEFLQKIGKGTFSLIHKVKKIETGEIFAIKIIEKKTLSEEELKVMQNEIFIMKIISHPHIVQFIEGWEGFNTFNYVLEFIEGQDLYEYITTRGALTENLARRVTCILIDTLKSIH